ncbi:hypothetical protein AVEN_70242-1 [Araneus ventricosus]|uniref:Uncharacterized protein n=1 Tax=Araneus ventricosus TaxID=182803 RepID=A0A4Y2GCV4_ARAVE|nr:hypothetical protein AVEN_70242-1 [Araneus ventricosus]
MSDNQYFLEQEGPSVDDPLQSDISRLFPQGVSSEVPGFGLPIARSAEEMTSRMEYPSRNFPVSDVETSADAFSDRQSLHECGYFMNRFVNELSSCRRDEDIRIGNESISSETEEIAHLDIQHLMEELQRLNRNRSRCSEATHSGSELSSSIGRGDGIGLLTSGRYFDICESSVLPCGRDADIRIGREFPSSRPEQDFHLSADKLDKRMVDIANQLLLLNNENNPNAENSDFASYLSLNDISIEYWQLYAKSRPENYDFAMNIMAYIELLNDSSWKATVSYFDENVKRMVTHIWNKKKVIFNNTIDLQRFNRDMILKLMGDFTQWSTNRNFDLDEFLNYCVLMCQLGVIARKCIFKEAPFYVIGQLRDRIKLLKFENVVQFMFEIVVKEYAK